MSGGVKVLAGTYRIPARLGKKEVPGGMWRVGALAVMVFGLAACAPTSSSPIVSQDVGGSDAGAHRLASTEIAALDNMSQSQIIERLGQPDFTRSDPPAEIWQYRGVSCVLDLFLYPEGSGMRVAHATSRNRQSLQAPADSCSPFAVEHNTATS